VKLKEVAGDYSMSGTRRMQAPGNIRSGFQTAGSRSSLENDLESENWRTRQDRQGSSVVYVENKGKVLAVSRGEDITNMNMPGGGIEPGETPEEAAERELWEETGLRAIKMIHVFSKVSHGKNIHFFKVLSYRGSLRSSDEGVTMWVDPEILLQGQYSDSFLDVTSRM